MSIKNFSYRFIGDCPRNLSWYIEFYHEKKDLIETIIEKKKLKDVARLGNILSGKFHIVFAHIAHRIVMIDIKNYKIRGT